MTVQFPMMRLKLPGGGGMSVTPYPTLKFSLLVPQALKLQFLPAIPGSNIHGKVNRSGDTMGGSLVLDHDPVIPLEAATKQYVDFVGAAGVTPGDKGDITVGGGGTWTIDNDVVTYAKMQNISAAGRLLGRGSAGGAGDPEEIVLGTNLSMSGTTLNATGGTAARAPLNAVEYGADPTGAADSTAAWTAMLAVLAPTYAGSIYFPRGKYKFNTALTVTLGGSKNSLTVFGDGQDVSVLYWPNVAGGLTIVYGDIYNSAHVSGLSFTTGQTNGGTGLLLQQALAVVNAANVPTSTITSVTMRGDDGYQVVFNWTLGVALDNVSNTQIENLMVVGSPVLNGIGLVIQGRAASSTYAVALNIAKSTFMQLAPAFQYGDWVQGVTIAQTNFTAVNPCIYSAPGAVADLQELLITNCQFNPTNVPAAIAHGILLQTYIGQLQICNNLFFVFPNSAGIAVPGTGALITGNSFTGGSPSAQTAIYLSSGTGSTITGNWIVGCATGIWLDTGTNLTTVIGNLLAANTTDILNSGSSNAIMTTPVSASAFTSFKFNLPLSLQGSASGVVTVKTVSAAGTWDLTLPTTGGTSGYFLQTNGSGVTTWAAAPGAGAGSGDVVGPASATDLAIARYDLTTGKLIQNSNVTISDLGEMKFFGGVTGVSPPPLINMGTYLDSAPPNSASHILMWSSDGAGADPLGFGVSGAQLNYVVPGNVSHNFYVGDFSQPTVRIGSQGINDTTSVAGNPATFWNPTYDFGSPVAATGRVHRFNRVLIGTAALASSDYPLSTPDWTTTLFAGVGGFTGGSQLMVTSTIGGLSISGATRTSDFRTWAGSATGGAQGVTGFAYNDDLGAGTPVAAGLVGIQVHRNGCTGVTLSQFDTNNLGAEIDVTPTSNVTGGSTFCLGLTPGAYPVLGTLNNVSAAIYIGGSTGSATQFRKGIVSFDSAFDTSVGSGGAGVAIEMARGQDIRWLNSADGVDATLWAAASGLFLHSNVGPAALNLGVAGFSQGSLRIAGATSGTIFVQPAASTSTWVLTLPTTAGTSGYFLQTNGSGVTTWAAAPGAGSGSPGGATTQVQFNTAGVFAGDDEFTYDSVGGITLGKATGGSGTIKLKGSTSGTVTVEPAPAAGTWTLRLPVDDGDAGEVLTTNGSGVTSWEAAAAGREVVTVARTYHVNNVTGNDADDGRTAPNAFATIQKAVNVVCDNIYWLNAQATISVAKTGVNYDERILLRPWQGSAPDNAYDIIYIIGDVTDPTYTTGVLVKPTTGTGGIITAFGPGARWGTQAISVDSTAVVAVDCCYAAVAGAYFRPMAGDLRSADLGLAALLASAGGTLHWDWDGANPAHVHGGGTPDYNVFLFALNDSSITINTPIVFDNNPAYWIVAWAEQNSFFQYYHNGGFTGVHPTGQRIRIRENSRAQTGYHTFASLPGDSWNSVAEPVDTTSTFNSHGFSTLFTFAGIPAWAFLEGAMLTITDCNTNVPGAAAAGGGAHRVPLWYTGSGWVVLAPVSGGGGGLTIGTSTITSGTTKRVLYDLAGVLQEAANFTIEAGSPNVTAGNAYLHDGLPIIIADLPKSNSYFGGGGNFTASGTGNNAQGTYALDALTTGSNNSADGFNCLTSCTSGGGNLAIGAYALNSTTSGSNNVALGVQALYYNTTGGGNVALGPAALFKTTVSDNVGIGVNAGTEITDGSNNLAIGANTLAANVHGGSNVAIGANCMRYGSDPNFSVGIGGAVLSFSAGNYNVGIGFLNLNAQTTGTGNLSMGANIAGAITNQSYNIFLGYNTGNSVAGDGNIVIGYNEARITSGAQNISIGFQSGVATATANDQLVIGNCIYGTGLDGRGTTISAGKIGIGVKAPAYELEVAGAIGGTALHVANADTTLARQGAGVLAVEGKMLYATGTVTLVDATPALDASLGSTFVLTATGDRTVGIPSNPQAGQKIVIAHTASGANRTLALNPGTGGFRFGTDVTALTATTSALTDYIGCIYNATANKWDVVSYAKGY